MRSNILEAMQASRLTLHQVLLDMRVATDDSPMYFAPVKIVIHAGICAKAAVVGFACCVVMRINFSAVWHNCVAALSLKAVL